MSGRATLYATAAIITLASGLPFPPAAAGDWATEPVAAFHQLIQNWVDAQNKGEAAAMAALFTEDAILLPPGAGEPIQGEDNIRRFFDQHVKHIIQNQKIMPTVLMLGGPRSMIDAGTWSGDVAAQDGAQATHVTGTYLAVAIFVDGRWKLWANSWQIKPAVGLVEMSTPAQVGTSTPNK